MPKNRKITSQSLQKSSSRKKGAAGVSRAAIPQKQSKMAILGELSRMTDLPQKEIKAVFSALRELVERHMKPRGSGEITLPELAIKIRRVVKKATKAREGRNPMTGESIHIPAKPAKKVIKAVVLKQLKNMLDTEN